MPGWFAPVWGAIQQLIGYAQSAAHEATLTAVLQGVNATLSVATSILRALFDATFGLSAIRSRIDTNQTSTDGQLASILAAIGTPQQALTDVQLPTTPPPGYGGGGGASAADVWDYVSPTTGNYMRYEVEVPYMAFTQLEGERAYQINRSPYFVMSGPFEALYTTGYGASYPPNFDVSALAPSDTVQSILIASNPLLDWFLDPDGQHWMAYLLGHPAVEIRCLVDDAWLAALKAAGSTPVAGLTAPVWPGLANVTLGTPVALSEGLTIAELMDGVIVELTSVPSQRGFYAYDDLCGYVNVGSLTFIDDNGDAEPFQPLGFVYAVYCPRSMQHAAAVKIRGGAGVSGTVTPWLVT